MKPKILIVINGGCVTAVNASEDMDIYIVDHDNFDHDETRATLDAARKPDKPDSICDIEDAVKTELAEYVCPKCDALLSESGGGEGPDGLCGDCAAKKEDHHG